MGIESETIYFVGCDKCNDIFDHDFDTEESCKNAVLVAGWHKCEKHENFWLCTRCIKELKATNVEKER
jgi:hypothetical protein